MKRLIVSQRDYDLYSCVMCSDIEIAYAIVNSAINVRDLSKNLVRVRSSNVWSYGINVNKNGDKTGTVVAQFKNQNGGPGDIYIYYDVPVSIYRKWVAAPSKGHFFWKYLRNRYNYSKLTGDKRGKLPNAIN